ncbi:MAG: hypothetical protein ACI81V_000882 [Lentimonas sp.]
MGKEGRVNSRRAGRALSRLLRFVRWRIGWDTAHTEVRPAVCLWNLAKEEEPSEGAGNCGGAEQHPDEWAHFSAFVELTV